MARSSFRPAGRDAGRIMWVAVSLWVFGALLAVAFWGAVIYVVLYFLMKWW